MCPLQPSATSSTNVFTDLVLRLPHVDEHREFLRAYWATLTDTPTFALRYQAGMPFAAYLQCLRDQQRGISLPPRHVPSTLLFAFSGPRIVGRVSIRHELNPWLEQFGGHIGYAVVPEFRRHGIGSALLARALAYARAHLLLRRVLVTCDDDNIGSIRVIERNGGVLENRVDDPETGKQKRRYWIDATQD